MANLPAQEALPGFRPVASRRSTQLHWDDIPAISGLATEPLSSTTVLPSMLRPIPCQKPYHAISGVSSMHSIVQGGRMLHHDLLLHLRFQTAQAGHEYVLRRHYMLHFQHQAPEFLIVFCHRPLLPQLE